MDKPLSSGISDKVNKDFKIHYGLKLWYNLREIHYTEGKSEEPYTEHNRKSDRQTKMTMT